MAAAARILNITSAAVSQQIHTLEREIGVPLIVRVGRTARMTEQGARILLLRSALTMQSARMIWAEGEALDIWRDMRSGGITGLHPTREGYLYLSANTSHFWKALCEKTGLAELANDPRYDTVRKRAQHTAEIVPKLRAALMQRTALEWEEVFGDQVPCATARRIEDMFDHPQVLAEEIVTAIEHPTLGSYRGVARPIKFGRTPGPAPFAAPGLGQDTQAVITSTRR